MNVKEIEKLICRALEEFAWFFKVGHHVLSLEDPGEEDGFHAYWGRDNRWESNQTPIDPLSCLLLKSNPEKNLQKDDAAITSTLSTFLDVRPSWIRSFQDGWYGRNNVSDSITGYTLGLKFRKQYLK